MGTHEVLLSIGIVGKLFSALTAAAARLHVATRRLLDGTQWSIATPQRLTFLHRLVWSSYTAHFLDYHPYFDTTMDAVGYVATAQEHLRSLKNTRLAALRPPGEFFDWQRVSKPANSGEFMKRAGYNM